MAWASTTTGFRHPLAVWVLWDGEGTDPAADRSDPIHEIAKAIYHKLGGEWLLTDEEPDDEELHQTERKTDPFRELPAVEAEIPVFFLATSEPSAEEVEDAITAHPAERVVLLLVIESRMQSRIQVWRPVVRNLYVSKRLSGLTLIPVGTHPGHHDLFPETREEKGLMLDVSDGTGFYVALLGTLCRQLCQGELPRVFLSYTRSDAASTAVEIANLLRSVERLTVWQDGHDIGAGQNIRNEIASNVPKSFFLAVLSSSFVRRRWTRWEVGLAREHGRPMAVIDALQGSVRRFLPELANAPVLRWPPQAGVNRRDQVAAVVLGEMLRYLMHEQRIRVLAEAIGKPLPHHSLLPPGPSQGDGSVDTLVYADPPLTDGELRHYGRGSRVRYLTAAQYVATAGWPDWAARADRQGYRVGLSVSAPDNAQRLGLWDAQIHDLTVRVTRTLMCIGARLAYGGDLRPGGITDQLARIAAQYAPATEVTEVLHSFVSWPYWLDWRADHDAMRRRIRVTTPQMIEAPDAIPVEARGKKPDFATVEGRVAVSLALMRMRKALTEACDARVSVGGLSAGAMGRMPGIVEEVWLAFNAGQPVYLAAGFGGATRAIYDLLSGKEAPELTLKHQVVQAPIYAKVNVALATWGAEVDWEQFRRDLRGAGLEVLSEHNGLTLDENRALAKATDPSEVIYWVSKGLGKVFGSSTRAQLLQLQRRIGHLEAEVDRLKRQES